MQSLEEEDNTNINSENEGSKNKKTNKNNKNKNELSEKDLKKISKLITESLKKKGIDIYYISKYDLNKLTNEEKKELFTKKFKLPLEILY